MAEIYLDAQELFKLLVLLHEHIVVDADAGKFRESLLNDLECSMHIRDCYLDDLLQEAHSDLTAGQRQQDAFAGFSRYDEVCFRITYVSTFLYVVGPCINESAVFQLGYLCASCASFSLLPLLDAMPGSLPAMNAPDVSPDAVFGCVG